MPTQVQQRSGQYPIRVSLNVTVETSDAVDYLERATGEYRGVIIRESLNMGLVLYHRALEHRRRREAKKAAAEGQPPPFVVPETGADDPSAEASSLDVMSSLFPDGIGAPLDRRALP